MNVYLLFVVIFLFGNRVEKGSEVIYKKERMSNSGFKVGRRKREWKSGRAREQG